MPSSPDVTRTPVEPGSASHTLNVPETVPGDDGKPTCPTDRRCRLAITFTIEGDLRFISHRDNMRLFQRALVRAGLPVRYSAGFNPRIRLWLPLPRPVGVAAADELLIVEFAETASPSVVLESLGVQIPDGVTLHTAERVTTKGIPQPTHIEYRLPIEMERNGVRECTTETKPSPDASPECAASGERSDGRPTDGRPLLESISRTDRDIVACVDVTLHGVIRPKELLSAMGFEPAETLHRLRRTAVRWQWPSQPLEPAAP